MHKYELVVVVNAPIEDDARAAVVEKVKDQVIDWLFRHIKSADRSVAEYINLHNNADIV